MPLIALNLTRVPPGWWGNSFARLAAIFALTLAFAALAHLVRGVSRSGALAGAIVCLALFASVGPGGFAGLLAVFAITWAVTRWGLASKQRLGTAERKEGRTASQVLANTGMAAACAVCYSGLHLPLMLLAMGAALAEAAADTASSECGQALSQNARLITTFDRVPAGTDGGITAAGTLGGVVAALLVTLVCKLTGLLSEPGLWFATSAGLLGMIVDSYLGALLERRGWLGNDSVNFISTVFAGVAAAVLASLW